MSGKEKDRVLLLSTFRGMERKSTNGEERKRGALALCVLTNSSGFIVSLLYVCVSGFFHLLHFLFYFFYFFFGFVFILFLFSFMGLILWGCYHHNFCGGKCHPLDFVFVNVIVFEEKST